MCQLNLEVSLFLSDSFHTFENRLLPNDVIFLRNIGEAHEEVGGSIGGTDDQLGHPTEAGGLVQHDFESASASKTSLPEIGHPGRIRTHVKSSSESMGFVETSQRPESVQVLRHHIWSNGSCIVFEPISGARPE
jgi:hypothetical protein